MSDGDPTKHKRRVPGWMKLAIGVGVPVVVTTMGILIGASAVEIVIFTMFSMFSIALMLLYALG